MEMISYVKLCLHSCLNLHYKKKEKKSEKNDKKVRSW